MLELELRTLSRRSPLLHGRARSFLRRPCRTSSPLLSSLSQSRTRGVSTATPTATAAKTGLKKPFYVTTPIFYVNAAPHVGHMYNMILCDILKRWHVLLGDKDAKLLTGTDEHGLKIQQAAAAQGVDPQALCDQNCQTFKNLAQVSNVSYDYFIRTTDENHKDAVRFFWDMLNHRDYIYVSKHEGWYCVSDETFYPASSVAPSIDPTTGRRLMASLETGKEVEWTSEENYHFKLSAFRDRLLQFYKENPTWIRPQNYMDAIVAQVEAGLSDLSISRPAKRLSWGIRAPSDEGHTIYVWLDALVNYLTYAGYPFTPGQEHKSIWPADVHVIGKDIVRFHAIYWPAFLMALDLPLPKNILTHAHWTMNRAKMSKSLGNVVNPLFALERFDVDTLRYFFAAEAALAQDSDYENRHIVERYKKGLQWGIGNMASRLVRSKKWSVGGSVKFAREGRLPEPEDVDMSQIEILKSLNMHVKKHMDELDPKKAIQNIMNLVYQTNRYMQTVEPWKLAVNKSKNPDENVDPQRVDRVVYTCAEGLRLVGILMQPFMPTKAAQLLDMLGVEEDKRGFEDAVYGADLDYGTPKVPLKKGTEGVLFPPLVTED